MSYCEPTLAQPMLSYPMLLLKVIGSSIRYWSAMAPRPSCGAALMTVGVAFTLAGRGDVPPMWKATPAVISVARRFFSP